MSRGPLLGSRTVAATVVLAVAAVAHAVTEPPPEPTRLTLYDWMAVAPTVVAAEVVVDDARFVEAIVRTSIRGALREGAVFEIDQRRANRDREDGVPALDLTRGNTYLLLLQPPGSRRKEEGNPRFDLARGARGARVLPAEGSAATIDAALRLAAIRARDSDDYLWAALPPLLEDPNPVLVDTALDLYLKFRRENLALASLLDPLLQHPRPDFRRRAAVLMGRVLLRAGPGAPPERGEIVSELTGRARRDDVAAVRKAATEALAPLPDAGIAEALRAIADDDADQDVRFEAEKALAERAQGAVKRSD